MHGSFAFHSRSIRHAPCSATLDFGSNILYYLLDRFAAGIAFKGGHNKILTGKDKGKNYDDGGGGGAPGGGAVGSKPAPADPPMTHGLSSSSLASP